MARDDEARTDLPEERPQKSLVRRCEVCGVSGMTIEVREVWHDGMYFGVFCGRCEMRRRGDVPPRRRANSRSEDGSELVQPASPATLASARRR
jgi:hypothetical protein